MKPDKLYPAPEDPKKLLEPSRSFPQGVTVGADGRTAVARILRFERGRDHELVRTWDLATGECTVERRTSDAPIPGVPSPAGDARVRSEEGLALWSADGEVWRQPESAYGNFAHVRWATPRLLLVAARDALCVVSAKNGESIARFPPRPLWEGVTVVPGGLRFYTGAVLVDTATGEALERPFVKKGASVAFSPDGAVVAVADAKGRVTVAGDDVTRKLSAFNTGFASPQLAWLPDGSGLVVVDGVVGTLGIWRAAAIAPGVAIAASPARTLDAIYPEDPSPAEPEPAPEPEPEPEPTVEIEERGPVRIARTLRPSRLARHRAAIEAVLGGPLPDDVAAFYARCDGLDYVAERDGASLGYDETLLGLEAMFDGFKPHRQFRTVAAFEKYADDLGDLPHWGDFWSDDFEVYERDELRHFNALVRSKQLVRIAGRSEALILDFAPAAPKGRPAPPYQVALAHRGHEYFPLDVGFPEFVSLFERFGAAGWYLAYLSPAALVALNIDPVGTVEEGLAPFAAAWPDDVERIVARARRQHAAAEKRRR